jgi:hypothetical protein
MGQSLALGLALCLPLCARAWHAYDQRKHQLLKADADCIPLWEKSALLAEGQNLSLPAELQRCPCYHEATRPYSNAFIEELSLWPDLMSQLDVEHGETLFGSRWALEMIHKNQNPEDCKNAKFLISGGWPYGFGSRIHMEGLVLGASRAYYCIYI